MALWSHNIDFIAAGSVRIKASLARLLDSLVHCVFGVIGRMRLFYDTALKLHMAHTINSATQLPNANDIIFLG